MLRVVVDTREQAPWGFPEDVECVRRKLDAGDYALEGDAGFSIERKSLNDFLGTISSGWDRFCREVNRMHDYRARLVVVEGDFTACTFLYNWDGHIIPPRHSHPNLLPQFIAKRIAELAFMGVYVLFAGYAEQASL